MSLVHLTRIWSFINERVTSLIILQSRFYRLILHWQINKQIKNSFSILSSQNLKSVRGWNPLKPRGTYFLSRLKHHCRQQSSSSSQSSTQFTLGEQSLFSPSFSSLVTSWGPLKLKLGLRAKCRCPGAKSATTKSCTRGTQCPSRWDPQRRGPKSSC